MSKDLEKKIAALETDLKAANEKNAQLEKDILDLNEKQAKFESGERTDLKAANEKNAQLEKDMLDLNEKLAKFESGESKPAPLTVTVAKVNYTIAMPSITIGGQVFTAKDVKANQKVNTPKGEMKIADYLVKIKSGMLVKS